MSSEAVPGEVYGSILVWHRLSAEAVRKPGAQQLEVVQVRDVLQWPPAHLDLLIAGYIHSACHLGCSVISKLGTDYGVHC
jgi:hypothetical protein